MVGFFLVEYSTNLVTLSYDLNRILIKVKCVCKYFVDDPPTVTRFLSSKFLRNESRLVDHSLV